MEYKPVETGEATERKERKAPRCHMVQSIGLNEA